MASTGMAHAVVSSWHQTSLPSTPCCKFSLPKPQTTTFWQMLIDRSMLHHTNVDRLWAYWQFIQPQHSRFNTPYSGGSRYSTPKGAQIGPDSPLNPFKKANGDFHTTRSVDNIRDFGYSYQGLQYWEKSPAEMRQEATRLINRLYGPDNSELRRSAKRGENATTTQYFANLEVDVAELDRPCVLELYVGGQKAGDFVVMEQPRTGIIHGGFPLEIALEKAQMQAYSPESTVKSITSTLEVSIVKVCPATPNSTYR